MTSAALLLGLGAALPAAQPPTAPTAVPPSPIILDSGRADRTNPAPPPPVAAPAKAPVEVAVQDEGAAVTIRGVAFEGTRVPAVVARAAEPFVGRKASRDTLGKLATAMSGAYAHADVALYTVQIPQQDFRDGTVRVLVREGHVEAVSIGGDERDRAEVIALAARIKAETPLTRATLERCLSLMRDIPGLTLDAQLLAGRTPGGVVLALKLTHKKRSTLEAAFDNRTTRLLDDGQFTATAKTYGLLRQGDETSLVGATAANLKSFRYLALTHSTPLGADGVRLSLNAATISTRPRGSFVRGDAQVAGVGVAWPLIRSYTTNLVTSASLDGLNSDNAVLGSTIASEHTRAARAAAGFSIAKPKRSVTAALTLSRGLDILSARVMAPLADATFTKVNGRATLDQAVGKRVVARLRASGQWTRDPLPAGERFAVGGEEFGRAFETAVVTADRGVAGLAEVAYRPLKKGRLAASEVYSFIDGAAVRLVPRGAFTGADYDLASAGGGIRLAYSDKGALNLEGARALDKPYPGTRGGDWRVSVGWRLKVGK